MSSSLVPIIVFLLVMSVVLAIVAAVGHLLWLCGATIYRAIGGQPAIRTHPNPMICPVCGGVTDAGSSGCRDCGWQPGKPESLRPLEIAIAQIDQLLERRAIDEITHRSVVDALKIRVREIEDRPLPQRKAPLQDLPLPVARLDTSPEFVVAEAVDETARQVSTPAERVTRYMAQVSASETPAASICPAPEPRERKPFGEWLAAFMEEKHIRWGELVGGLLIVSCSIALVISFWSKIAERPILKFGVFNGLTAALFGLGLHAAKRWKLPTTSQGILITAMLLVPLNFLAIAAFGEGTSSTSVPALVGEVVSVVGFTTLFYLAARVVLPNWPVIFTIGVIGQCLIELLIRRFVGPGANSSSVVWSLATVSLAGYAGVNAGSLLGAARENDLSDQDGNRLLKLLGITSFATILAIGLLLFRTGDPGGTLRSLSALSGIASLPALAIGMTLSRRVPSSLSSLRTTGTSIAVFGAGILFAGVYLAWPQPATMLPTAAISVVVLTLIAVWSGISEAHLAAGPCATLAYLLVCLLVSGKLAWRVADAEQTLEALTSVASGKYLLGLVAVYGSAAWSCRALGRNADAKYHGWLTALIAIGSLAIVTWHGFAIPGDPTGATWIYGLYAVLAFAGAYFARNRKATWIGGGLLLAACVQGIVYRYSDLTRLESPWFVALLAQATALTLIAAAFRVRELSAARVLSTDAPSSVTQNAFDASRVFIEPCSGWSLATTCVGLFSTYVTYSWNGIIPSAITIGWLSLIWMALAFVNQWPAAFSAFQAALALCVVLAVNDQQRTSLWYLGSSAEFQSLHPYSLQAQGIALAVLSLVWIGVRAGLRRVGVSRDIAEASGWRAATSKLLFTISPSVDKVVSVAVIAVLAVLAGYAVTPGIQQELSLSAASGARSVPLPESFEFDYLPHSLAMEIGSWILLACVAGILVFGIRERSNTATWCGLTLTALAGTCLLSAPWETQVAVASAWRWWTTGLIGLISALVWWRPALLYGSLTPTRSVNEGSPASEGSSELPRLRFGLLERSSNASSQNGRGITRLRSPHDDERPNTFLSKLGGSIGSSALLIVLGLVPVILATYLVCVTLTGRSVVGPEPGSFFSRIGPSASYALPLFVISLFTVSHAIVRRTAGLTLAAAFVFNFSASVGVLLSVSRFQIESWWLLTQVNAIVSAGFAIGWMVVLSRRFRDADVRPAFRGPLQWQVGCAVGLVVVSLAPAFLILVLNPTTSVTLTAAAGWLGWSAVVLTAAALAMRRWKGDRIDFGLPVPRIPATAWGIGLASIVTLAACELHRWDTGNWVSYHTLLVGSALAGFGMFAVGQWHRDYFGEPVEWATLFLGTAIALSMRAVVGDPQLPWWTVGGLVAASVLSALQASNAQKRFVYLAAAALQTATNVWWLAEGSRLVPGGDIISRLLQLIDVNIIAACFPVIVWRWVHGRWIEGIGRVTWLPAAHRFLTTMGVVGLASLVILSLMFDAATWTITRNPVLAWLALSSVACAVGVCLWDRGARLAVLGLYITGLLLAGTVIDQLNLSLDPLMWTGACFLAAYSVGTSYLWSRRKGLAELARQLAIPSRTVPISSRTSANYSRTSSNYSRTSSIYKTQDDLAGHGWLVPANRLLATAVVVLGFWVQFRFTDITMRITAAQGVIAQALAIGMLARGERESSLRSRSLWLGVLGAIALGWSGLDPTTTGTFLHRTVVVAAALGAMSVLYGLGLTKLLRRENDWTRAAAELVPWLCAWAVATIGVLLVSESVMYWLDGHVDMLWPAILAIAVTLVGLAVASLLAAILPGRDPLGLSERRRQAYVYAAEGLIALLFLHVRLTMPWLFSGFFQQFWPLIVMLIAFLGVGLGELFRRQKRMVLAEPLERTGVLLPMLPVMGYWVAPSVVHYSPLMLSVGVLYGALSVMRRSFGFGMLAALAVNGGLWYLLYDTEGVGMLDHPQLWLIPPALCVMAGAYINRRQLSDSQMTTIRYLAATIIYTSSTADIFLNGVAEAPWLPFVLAAISIGGIAAGIMLRVRAFLFLGTSFLGLSLMTVIWFAAVDLEQTWLWFVTGIAAGIAIFAFFAFFEKKRHNVLALVERLKTWEA